MSKVQINGKILQQRRYQKHLQQELIQFRDMPSQVITHFNEQLMF